MPPVSDKLTVWIQLMQRLFIMNRLVIDIRNTTESQSQLVEQWTDYCVDPVYAGSAYDR